MAPTPTSVLSRPAGATGRGRRTRTPARARAGVRVGVLAVMVAALIVVVVGSIALGSRSVPLPTVVDALLHYDPELTDHTVVRDMRVPRTLLGLLVGAALGLGGALLQGVSRNPLADPGIMGINAGAATCVVLGIAGLGIGSVGGYVWLALAGAALATALVYAVASVGREGATPVKLALAGAAVTAGLSSVSTGIVMTDLDTLNEMRFWLVGSLAGRYLPVFWQVAPFIVVGAVLALGCARALNGLALGEDTARSLGQRVDWSRAAVFVAVTLLCGAATAACGPIVFLGLVAPHVARIICGPDYRWILPYSLVLAPTVYLAADVAGRLVLSPAELEVGVVLGVLGAPVFVVLVRHRRLVEL
jgi:iron complex transport system permease protein